MVVRLPTTRKGSAFVTSDRGSVDEGRNEVNRWMSQTGHKQLNPDRVFAIFDHGHIVREWNVVEKAPAHRR